MREELTIDYILDAFSFLQDWESRYEFIDDLGKRLPVMDPELKTDENRVHACMSLVWIKSELDPNGKVVIHGDSDASTIKGLVAILVSLYRDRTPAEILDIDPDARFAELGLFDHLSPTRHVGVYAMFEHTRSQVRQLASS